MKIYAVEFNKEYYYIGKPLYIYCLERDNLDQLCWKSYGQTAPSDDRIFAYNGRDLKIDELSPIYYIVKNKQRDHSFCESDLDESISGDQLREKCMENANT